MKSVASYDDPSGDGVRRQSGCGKAGAESLREKTKWLSSIVFDSVGKELDLREEGIL